uniref:Uncharacterized protein n=1 Tax=Noctiluca scintillans TaxID=2966 RepID=A0A7S1EYT9_NOCSC|mmetsp:Transcript_1932/g.5440  ORF Transcript_1932/g.5440 Transcript_1932/m.5440 type:complete len:158 (+) Transcript_1932:50-523(+)
MEECTDVRLADLLVCGGCCCVVTSIFCKTPDCFGCKNESLVCCWQCESACCKPAGKDNLDHKACICYEGGNYCVRPTTCCQCQSQECCIDYRCAFPCTDKVPCIFTILPFCVCGADWGLKIVCCKKGGDIITRLDSSKTVVEGIVMGAPHQQDMLGI